MGVVADNLSSPFYAFLCHHDQGDWDQLVEEMIPRIHPVDRTATPIWFSFWPLKLSQSLLKSEDPVQLAKDLELDGNYRLQNQLDHSVKFLFGSRYWWGVKRAVLAYTQDCSDPGSGSLEKHILRLAENLSDMEKISTSLLVGITAVAFMALRQIGIEAFAAISPVEESSDPLTAEEMWKRRNRQQRKGWIDFLRGGPREHTVTFEERKTGHTFPALPGQDLSMASAREQRDYTAEDPRRIAGPIPAQCRSGSCGYCWIGILHNRENLCEISEFERKRLKYFGYASNRSDRETHPTIRLACQSKCYGPVSVVIPPWNGVLKGRSS